ncbi:MAG: hypothetical protein ACEPOV_00850 [Hyphomicrobiales bacterium]
MKYTNTIIFLVLFMVFHSCSKKKSVNSSDMQLSIYDSLDIPYYKNPYIKQYNKNTGTYIGVFDSDVIAFNHDSIVFTFNRKGYGPEEYNHKFIYKYCNVVYYNDTTVVLNNHQYLKFYNLQGDYIKRIEIDTASPHFSRNVIGLHPDNNSIFFFHGDNSYDEKAYEKGTYQNLRPNFFTLNSNTKQTQCCGSPEKENIVIAENKYFPMNEPIVTLNKTGKKVNVLFSGDFKLFSYDMNQTNTYTVHQLSPDHPTKQHFYSPDDVNKGYLRKYYMNTYYKNLYTSADTTLTIYREGIPELTVDEIHGKQQDAYNLLTNMMNFYIEFYIDKKKHTKDIIISKDYEAIDIRGINEVVLRKKDQELTIDNKPIMRLYFARIEKI